jgi:hypothetical protein
VLAGCSRPPYLGDFSRSTVPNGVSVHTPVLGGRRLTPTLGWRLSLFAPPVRLLSARRFVQCSGALCSSHNRARHLRSSARRGCPASHRVFFTRVAYAPPSRGSALRRWSHGSPRLILAVHTRDRALPKSLPLMRADRRRPPLPPRPTPAAADRPLAAFFHVGVCQLPSQSTLWLSSGGRLSATVRPQ